MTTVKLSPRGRNLVHSRAESIKLYAWQLENDINDDDEFDVDIAIRRVELMMITATKLDQHLKALRRAATKTLKVVEP